MPSLLGSIVTTNYVKTKPKTLFGTRQLRFITITATNAGSGTQLDFTKQIASNPTATSYTDTTDYSASNEYDASNSYYSAAIRALQSVAEVYAIGTPTKLSFTVAIADQTVNDSDSGNTEGGSYGDLVGLIKSAVQGVDTSAGNSANGASFVITPSTMVGNTLQTILPITAISYSGSSGSYTAAITYSATSQLFNSTSGVGNTVNVLGFSKPGAYTSTTDLTVYNGSWTVTAIGTATAGSSYTVSFALPSTFTSSNLPPVLNQLLDSNSNPIPSGAFVASYPTSNA